MKRLCILLPAIMTLAACNNNNSNQEELQPVKLESIKIEKAEGDCAEESYENKCAKVLLSLPSVTEGNEVLKKAVTTWAQDFAISMLSPDLELDKMPGDAAAIEASIQAFIAMHQQLVAEMPEGPGFYTVEVSDTVLLNDGKHLTLFLDAYSYAGGAHPNTSAAVATFDVNTGEILKLEDVVTDLDILRSIAEKKYREEKAEVFDEGFDFSPDWPFKLADNTGLTAEGIFFYYVPYEVAAYAIGPAAFVITFEELKGILKESR